MQISILSPDHIYGHPCSVGIFVWYSKVRTVKDKGIDTFDLNLTKYQLIVNYPTLTDTRGKLFDNEECFGVVTSRGL